MAKVLCSGEILVDLISQDKGKNLVESYVFKKKVGGAPFNVAVSLKRLGLEVSFLGKLGKDQFSDFLLNEMKKEGIDLRYFVLDEKVKSTLAFVARDEKGKPDFVFFRDNPADANLKEEDVVNINPSDFSLFHFGSISLLFEPSRSTYISLMKKFVKSNIPVSYDPNIRTNLIKNRKRFLDDFFEIVKHVDILKMSEEDMFYISPNTKPEKFIEKLPKKDNAMVFITLGEKGCLGYFKGEFVKVPAFKVKVVDSTGCGDAFMGAVIYKYLIDKPKNTKDIENVCVFANAVSALVLTKLGAAPAMPDLKSVERFLREAGYENI